jgi:SAM-dependent methyltransferase
MAPLDLVQVFSTAFSQGSLLKCTLSKASKQTADGLKNVYLRPVQLKSGLKIAFNYRYATRDEVKNYTLAEAEQHLKNLFDTSFLHADVFTTDTEFHFSKDKNGTISVNHRNTPAKALPDTAHNREKHRLLDPSAPWFHALGITNAKAEVLASAQDKWKQINKYLEIIQNLIREHPLVKTAHIADMGAGKGYLTFALYDFLRHHLGDSVQVTGIELRPNLVAFCQDLAQKMGFQGLQFIAQDISQYHPERLDMLIALHACDIATDLAIAAGLREGAGIIVVAPCCHKQIRRDMATQNELAPILRHGILEERQAEIVTDGIRAMIMEAEGYKTQVFEFISTEHTAKNVMITATRSTKPPAPARRSEIIQKIAAVKQGFGIREHYLERLVGI